jgi:putative glycosyltransferase
MKLSIVTSLYNSAPFVEEFYYQAILNIEKMKKGINQDFDYEIIFVNDGSIDSSIDVAVNLSKIDKRIVVLDLSRNFGHHNALLCGLEHAKGELVFLIDSDLEEKLEWLFTFYQQLNSMNCDVIFGVQRERKGNFFEVFSGKLFYFLFNKLTGLNLTINITTARLMTRRYVDALLRHKEVEVFLAGLLHITGFKQDYLVVEKGNSHKTTYSIKRKISLAINAITSFTTSPLWIVFYLGCIIFSAAGLLILLLSFKAFFYSNLLPGWFTTFSLITIFGGVNFFFLGLISIYLGKILQEVKSRPRTIIKQVFRD